MENNLNVTVQTLTGVKYGVTVKPTDTVEELKMKLYETTEIRNKIRILLNKAELDGNTPLQDHGIESFQILQMLLIPPEDITVTVNVFKKGSVSVKTNDNASVSDLRNALKDKKYSLGTAPRIYDLFLNSVKLDNEKLLRVYGIEEGSVLNLTSPHASFRVTLVDAFSYLFVRVMEVKGTDTVAKVKSDVAEIVSRYEKRKVQGGDFVLYYRPAYGPVTFDELDCDALTMREYGVEPYDQLIYIRYNGINEGRSEDININYLGAETTVYDVRTSECVLGFQLKIQDQLGVPVVKQKLSIPGMHELVDDLKIEHFQGIGLELFEDGDIN